MPHRSLLRWRSDGLIEITHPVNNYGNVLAYASALENELGSRE